MSEKPASHHERLGSPELETIKREILTVLAQYNMVDAVFAPTLNGRGFTITTSKALDHSIFQALQHIAVQYDEHIFFDVENIDSLTIKVEDESDNSYPTLH